MAALDPHFKAKEEEAEIEKQIHRQGDEIRIKPWGLDIIWGNDNRYWRVPDPTDPREEPPLDLLQVCWLEVTRKINIKDLQMKPGKYNISFNISMKKDAFGWSGMPIYIMAKIGKKGKYNWRNANLSSSTDNKHFEIPEGEPLQIEVSNPAYEDNEELLFGLYEIWKGRWKGGLQIYEAIIRPSKTTT